MRIMCRWFSWWELKDDTHDQSGEDNEEEDKSHVLAQKQLGGRWIQVDSEWTVDDLKEVIHDVFASGVPVCRLQLLLKRRNPLVLAQTQANKSLADLGIRDRDIIFVKDNQGSGPPGGGAMVAHGLIRSPSVETVLDESQFAEAAPVLRCRPFIVQSLRFTPFVIEFDVRKFRQTRRLAYAHTYITSAQLSIVEFLQAPRFDSRWGTRAGVASGGWRQVCTKNVDGPSLFGHHPDRRGLTPQEEATGHFRVSIIPPNGWTNGGYFHVVLNAEGPFDEMRCIAWAFKIRLRKRPATSRGKFIPAQPSTKRPTIAYNVPPAAAEDPSSLAILDEDLRLAAALADDDDALPVDALDIDAPPLSSPPLPSNVAFNFSLKSAASQPDFLLSNGLSGSL